MVPAVKVDSIKTVRVDKKATPQEDSWEDRRIQKKAE
jgi:hypothetical protein